MPLDLLTIGEALVEIMRADIDQPLNQPGPFNGPYPSGAPFIFAVQAARLGTKAAAIGAVGADAFGDCLRDQLRADGVSTSGLRSLPDHTTGIAFVAYRADGARDYVFSLGAGAQLAPDMLEPALFAGLRCFHLMGSTLSMSERALEVCREALDMATAAGALISFDPNLRPELLPPDQARVAFADFIAAADVLLPTADELLLLTDTAREADAVAQLLASPSLIARSSSPAARLAARSSRPMAAPMCPASRSPKLIRPAPATALTPPSSAPGSPASRRAPPPASPMPAARWPSQPRVRWPAPSPAPRSRVSCAR